MVSDSTAGYCFISLAPSKISSGENELIEESELIRSWAIFSIHCLCMKVKFWGVIERFGPDFCFVWQVNYLSYIICSLFLWFQCIPSNNSYWSTNSTFLAVILRSILFFCLPVFVSLSLDIKSYHESFRLFLNHILPWAKISKQTKLWHLKLGQWLPWWVGTQGK